MDWTRNWLHSIAPHSGQNRINVNVEMGADTESFPSEDHHQYRGKQQRMGHAWKLVSFSKTLPLVDQLRFLLLLLVFILIEFRFRFSLISLRWAGLKIFTRHREVQFVQWTIQSSSFHPILLDTLRRIIDTNQIAKGMMIEKDIKINRAESSGDFEKAKKIRKQDFPWDGVKGKEFEATGVEGELSFRSDHLHFLPFCSLMIVSLSFFRIHWSWDLVRLRSLVSISLFATSEIGSIPIDSVSNPFFDVFSSLFQVSLCNL